MLGRARSRVLLVDDEPLVRRLVSGYLKDAGYAVRTAVDGLDALGKLRSSLPDLIISDLDLPRMSGYEFLNVVRRRFPQIPVVVTSEHAADKMPEGLAADAYFQKNGFGLAHLLLTILALARNPPPRTSSPYAAVTSPGATQA